MGATKKFRLFVFVLILFCLLDCEATFNRA
nr:MAG TPA: hypothetical protein [Caudoviricetes sp.]